MQMGELWQFSPRAIVNYCILTTAQSKGRPAPCATVWIMSPKILCVGGLGPRRVLLGKVVGHLKGGALWEVLRSLWDMPLKDMLGSNPSLSLLAAWLVKWMVLLYRVLPLGHATSLQANSKPWKP